MNRDCGARVSLTVTLVLAQALAACLTPPEQVTLGDTAQTTTIGDLGGVLGTAVATGSTAGLSGDTVVGCAPSMAPAAIYTWTAPSAGAYIFTTLGSSFDTVLGVTRREALQCNDDSAGSLQSTVNVTLAMGERVSIAIGGFAAAAGTYQLNISRIPALGMHLWLRTDTGITPATRVGAWADQSGQGRDATMTAAVRQPFYAPGLASGWPVVRFTGAESLAFSSVVTPTMYSIFVVGRNTNSAETFGVILGPGGNSPNNQLRWENGTAVLVTGTGNATPTTTSTIGDTRVFHSLLVRYDGTTQSVYRDGGLVSSLRFAATLPWIFASLGSFYSSDFLKGDIAEVLIYDRALPEADRLAVNAYLRAKYRLP